jgi:iron complex transport system substrate-binding protein
MRREAASQFWHVLAFAGMLATSTAAAGQTAATAFPQRIASFNLCADQLVVALADPGQVAGLSPYAADPVLSVVAEKARAFPRLDWQAESTIKLDPDLVLVGPSDRPATRRMLAAQGVRVVDVDFIADLPAARAQIRRFAALFGHPERGEILIAGLDEAVARLKALPRAPYATALIIERGGYTAGPQSLAATLVAQAGLRPPEGSPQGYGGFLPLERLLMLQPDVVFLKDAPQEARDQGALYFTHPALRALYPPSRRIALPTRFTLCGGPALVAALDYLTAELSQMAAGGKEAVTPRPRRSSP